MLNNTFILERQYASVRLAKLTAGFEKRAYLLGASKIVERYFGIVAADEYWPEHWIVVYEALDSQNKSIGFIGIIPSKKADRDALAARGFIEREDVDRQTFFGMLLRRLIARQSA